MRKEILAGFAASVTLMVPSVATAQETTVGDVFILGSVGYHDLGVASDVDDDLDFDIDDASLIYGAVVGFDVPVTSNAFVGVEANYHFGNDVIEADYGVTARAGYKSASGTKFYVRGGYQVINLDPAEFIDDEDIDIPSEAFDGIDDTDGDYLVGVGVDAPLGGVLVRAAVDTISFDTVRATVGVGLAF